MSNCPYCGKPISLHKATAGGWSQQATTQRFNAPAPVAPVAPVAEYAGYDYERRSPAREPNLQADVAVPAAQSLLTGFAVGIPAASVLGMLGYAQADCLTMGAGLGLVSLTATWLFKLGLHNNLLWLVESVTGRDLNGDETVGQPVAPAQEKEPVRVELANDRTTRLVDLPATDAQLQAVAQRVLSGGAFSRRGLADVLSEAEYKTLTEAMLRGKLLAAKGAGSTAGVELTSAGRAVMRRLLVVAGGGGARQPVFEVAN